MGIQVHRDPSKRRLVISPDEGTSADRVTGVIVDLVAGQPDLIEWDWILDVSHGLERFLPSHTDDVSEAFGGQGGSGTYTVLVAGNPMMSLFARTLDFRFPGRSHLVAPTMAAAERILDRRRAAAA